MKICDNNIFTCDWAKDGRRFRIWLVEGSCEASAEHFSDAEDGLLSIIEERYKCASPIITYLKPSPEGALPPQFSWPSFVSVSGVKQAALVSRFDEIFSLGKCASCGRPKGERTEAEITIDVSGARQDALYVRALKRSVFSQEAIERFGINRIQGAIIRRVKLTGKASEQYFEIVSLPVHLCMTSIAVKGLQEPVYKLSAKHCSECGLRTISYMSEPYYIECFRREQIGDFVDAFMSESTGALCLRRRVWRNSTIGENLKGLFAAPVGFAKDEDIDSSIVYRELARRG